ncbi:MAG TPA: glutamate-cysteine ligase family protein [Methanoregula sp.]|nr:glutamate-cysteine ligase family protein [Methanoregula sp.]
MTIGTEHEYSINDNRFNALPISDQIIKTICGRFASEILFGETKLSKELQKTVVEITPRTPSDNLVSLEGHLFNGVRKFYHIFRDRYWLLGLGMHPTLTLNHTAVWDHEEREFYEAYDRIFNIHQHGWLNIQALQINLSYSKDKELLSLYNRIRSLLPYLIAVTASSPMVEGDLTGIADNRLVFYRENQKEIPLICNRIIPEKIRTVAEYRAIQDKVFSELRLRGAAILCEEWVNSSGLIIRFSRNCLEIKALDEQECIHSDMAVCAFVRSLLRCPTLSVPQDQQSLLEATDRAIRGGTAEVKPELADLFNLAWKHANAEERLYLPVIANRIERGSLAELIRDRYERDGDIIPILHDMAMCLRMNSSYGDRAKKW